MDRIQNWLGTLSQQSKIVFTAILLLTVALPRFNDNHILVKNISYDAKYFIAYVEYFRGQQPSAPVRPASNWRIFVPAVASVLPFAPNTSVNIINLLCISLSLVLLFSINSQLGVSETVNWLCMWLYIFSFPVFYYSTITYTDPGVILFITLGVYACINSNFGLMLICIFFGSLAKESILELIAYYFFYHLFPNRINAFRQSLILFSLYIVINILLRTYAPIVPKETSPPLLWTFSKASFLHNFYRLNSWLALPLSFGVCGFFFLYTMGKTGLKNSWENPLQRAATMGLLCAFGLFVISYCTTVADGRLIWQTYSFMIPAIAVYFSNHQKNHQAIS